MNALKPTMLKPSIIRSLSASALLKAPLPPKSIATLSLVAIGLTGAAGSAFGMSTNVQWKIEAGVKEAYDSNVYLQDVAPTNAVPGAVPAKKGSFVTTVSPRLFMNYAACPAFNATLSYTPDFTWYESAHSEDHLTHRFGAKAGGTVEGVVWSMQNSFIYIDGSKQGPIFGRPGDCPAVGGIPLRERRAAFVYKSGFQVTETFGKWMIRPVASAYVHDFKTDLRTSPPGGLYENYIDRQDINGGLDVGYSAARSLYILLGYRYGRQDQFKGPFGPGGAIIGSPYGNTYHRILIGAEGAPLDWLRLSVLAGPDIRQFDNKIPGFEGNELLYYVDAAVTLLPTRKDAITLSNKRYEQPAFSSFSMYEDITYDLTWKHRIDDHWAGSVGFRLYIGDWQRPVNRDDWIYTPSASVNYTYDRHLSADLTYSYDSAENETSTRAPGAAYANGRQFTRHIVALSVRYAF